MVALSLKKFAITCNDKGYISKLYPLHMSHQAAGSSQHALRILGGQDSVQIYISASHDTLNRNYSRPRLCHIFPDPNSRHLYNCPKQRDCIQDFQGPCMTPFHRVQLPILGLKVSIQYIHVNSSPCEQIYLKACGPCFL